jgi:alanine racemase
MITWRVSEIAKILGITIPASSPDLEIGEWCYDNRRLNQPGKAVFIALQGKQDGHQFVNSAYLAGVRVFLIDKAVVLPSDAVLLKVNDVLTAFQQLAAFWRSQLPYPVIAITGSNGKTIVKEWLFALLKDTHKIERSPQSYNSQLGVALSILGFEKQADFALVEAGISKRGEMNKLADIIKPDIGILTNIGSAHDAGFENRTEKLKEKLILFEKAKVLFYPSQDSFVSNLVQTWASKREIELKPWDTVDFTEYLSKGKFPFSDSASLLNIQTALVVASALNIKVTAKIFDFTKLSKVSMRLQKKEAVFGITLIDDSYSADMESLQNALLFLSKQTTADKRVAVIGCFEDLTISQADFLAQLVKRVERFPLNDLILVGFEKVSLKLAGTNVFFMDKAENLKSFDWRKFESKHVLFKGSHQSGFHKIIKFLEKKVHETCLEIDIDALENNYRYFRQQINKSTKIMAMVKAFGYGAGSIEVAAVLQNLGVDYLAVAYTDEGVELRKDGVYVPIMVLNPQHDNLETLTEYNLEPVIYSYELLHQYASIIQEKGILHTAIHIEFDTGMHRLGFPTTAMKEILEAVGHNGIFEIASVFSHLAAAENPIHDAFTANQIADFKAVYDFYKPNNQKTLFHILNTPGIIRHTPAQFDMVRLGIGLFGIETSLPKDVLEPVASLKARISQIKPLQKGETIGYSRQGVLHRDSQIAIIPIGYADGLRRNLGNGRAGVWLNEKQAPFIGNICMDMAMIDVTEISCKVGDEVEIFGKNQAIEVLAEKAGTIAYELLSAIPSRVNRIYVKSK